MKPCSNKKKSIAWMHLGALGDQPARDLRAHLETCEGCRGYLKELSALTEKLARAETLSEIEASESFHQKLADRLRAEEPASTWATIVASFRAVSMNWRLALTVFSAIVVAVTIMFTGLGSLRVSAPPQTTLQTVPRPGADTSTDDFPPTIANYQMVANRSLEQLDVLLTRQGNRNPPHVPLYSAATFSSANAPD